MLCDALFESALQLLLQTVSIHLYRTFEDISRIAIFGQAVLCKIVAPLRLVPAALISELVNLQCVASDIKQSVNLKLSPTF
jgi:hypothetical protein